jgi:ABC-type transport system involved in cytochrome bd biosynthesis fused ATPase/permease subunit
MQACFLGGTGHLSLDCFSGCMVACNLISSRSLTISGKDVNSSTFFTGMSAFSMAAAVPPVETSAYLSNQMIAFSVRKYYMLFQNDHKVSVSPRNQKVRTTKKTILQLMLCFREQSIIRVTQWA